MPTETSGGVSGTMTPESYEISKDRIELLIRYLHTYTGFSEAAFREAVEAKLGIDLGED